MISRALMEAYANSRSSPGLVAAYSADASSDGEPSAQLNVMPSPQPFWRNDRTMDVLSRSPFGLTWRRLTDDRGAELLTSFLAAFPARTFHAPGRAPASTERQAASGERWPGSLARYDHATRSWRTAQCSLFGGLEEFSETWPRWGTMRDGECYRQPTPSGLNAFREVIARHLTTCASASGSSPRLPTPIVTDGKRGAPDDSTGHPYSLTLSQTIRSPTATADDANNTTRDSGMFQSLTRSVRMTTPQAHDAHPGRPERVGRFGTKAGGRNLNDEIALAKTVRAPTPRNNQGPSLDDKHLSLDGFVRRAPTPRSEDSQCAGGHRGNPDTLTAFIRLPTARASKTTDESEQAWEARHAAGKVATPPLGLAVRRLQTATTQDASNNGGKSQMNRQVGGQLNPTWEDWFMGWPIGWTDARHSATDRFRQWCASHGAC